MFVDSTEVPVFLQDSDSTGLTAVGSLSPGNTFNLIRERRLQHPVCLVFSCLKLI